MTQPSGTQPRGVGLLVASQPHTSVRAVRTREEALCLTQSGHAINAKHLLECTQVLSGMPRSTVMALE